MELVSKYGTWVVTKKDFLCSYEGSGIELELDQVLDFGKARIGYRMWEVAKYFLSSSKTFLEQFHTGVRMVPDCTTQRVSPELTQLIVLLLEFSIFSSFSETLPIKWSFLECSRHQFILRDFFKRFFPCFFFSRRVWEAATQL